MWGRISKGVALSGVGLSLTVALSPLGYAVSPINSTRNGQIIQGGTYYNTANASTKFVNNGSGGLWLKSGTTVRGLEVNNCGSLTNNGGNIVLSAPGQVVRIDGTFDVRGLVNGQGAYLGNGGKVTVNSAYVFQNGNIFAQGINGGHVQFNVNSATFGPQAKIDASGTPDGLGGTIRIKATGVVDIQKGSALVTSGIPGVDSNVIEIVGGLVNNAGLIKADGIAGGLSGDISKAAGGTVKLVAQGNINLNPVVQAMAQSKVFTSSEGQTLFNGIQTLAKKYDANIRNLGSITADGKTLAIGTNQFDGNGGRGGSITLIANKRILNSGLISASGGEGEASGNGGQISLLGRSQCPRALSQNDGQILANGGQSFTPLNSGGDGGRITLANLVNNGTIAADGGEGARGGDGGIMALNRIWNFGVIHANGAVGSSLYGGLGGLGGTITATDFVNAKTGALEVKGGDGFGFSNGTGRGGGVMLLTNFTNNGRVTLDGGAGDGNLGSPGGDGGRLTGKNVINTGTISANGGGSILQGGMGGLMTFTKLKNTGRIEANGGDTIHTDYQTTGGNGGRIEASQVTNTGTIEALGGTGDTNGLNGEVIFF